MKTSAFRRLAEQYRSDEMRDMDAEVRRFRAENRRLRSDLRLCLAWHADVTVSLTERLRMIQVVCDAALRRAPRGRK